MKAIVLLSGGIDSTVVLAMALAKGRICHAISFNYGQRHKIELESAKSIAKHYEVSHHIISIDPSTFDHSSLINQTEVPKNRTLDEIRSSGTPSTYVPARNTLFLALAMTQAEVHHAQEIYVGANAMDSIYPDCRPEFLNAFQSLMNVATKQACEGKAPQLIAPLLNLDKSDIIKQGRLLNVPLELTFSCYSPIENVPCLSCDACILRNHGLKNKR